MGQDEDRGKGAYAISVAAELVGMRQQNGVAVVLAEKQNLLSSRGRNGTVGGGYG
jgi:hypothetical protein